VKTDEVSSADMAAWQHGSGPRRGAAMCPWLGYLARVLRPCRLACRGPGGRRRGVPEGTEPEENKLPGKAATAPSSPRTQPAAGVEEQVQ